MNEVQRQAPDPRNVPTAIVSLDAQLVELIEVVWACEVAARREDRIDNAIRYGVDSRSR